MTEERLKSIVPALALTAFAVMYWYDTWQRYRIVADGIQTTGHVTGVGGHNSIYYTYSANGVAFSGHGPREYRDPRYSEVGVGGTTVVWYSASHPSVSTPRRPDTVLVGLPWIVLVTLLDLVFLFALVTTWKTSGSLKHLLRETSRQPGAG